MDDTLRMGDIVCLYSEESSGFVYATQTSFLYNEIAVGSRQDRVQPAVTDQHIVAFQVCVANRYKLNKNYLNLLSRSKEDKDVIAQAKVAAQSETEDNLLDHKRQQGKNVLYGQVIQLRHLFTGKYIHVSLSRTSDLQSINLAVCLMPQNSKNAQFRVLPRYKVKDEGDAVQINDQIVLESVKSPGQFLHVSHSLFSSHSIYHNSHELNLSFARSGFTVYRIHKSSADDKDKMKVGDLLRFYHKEMEAYLVAEGLFNDEITEDVSLCLTIHPVHLRIRPVDQANPNTMIPSTSAVTYWQIELEEGPISGGVVKWKQQCRIIHMCTRKYLNVTTEGQVTLTPDGNERDTIFRFHSVISIEAVQEMRFDDAFTIQAVSTELKDIFHDMAGMVPFLQKLVKESDVTVNAKSANVIVRALREMKEFLIVDNVPSKNRQKLIRNLGLVELLVSLLQNKRTQDRKHSYLAKIFVATYDVLYAYLRGNSRKNELYIAKHTDLFLMQLNSEDEIGLSAAHMVMELIRDNRKIVVLITHDHIDKFIDLLSKVKNHRYLELLGVLCVCDGLTITDNQNYITKAWLNGESRVWFYESVHEIMNVL